MHFVPNVEEKESPIKEALLFLCGLLIHDFPLPFFMSFAVVIPACASPPLSSSRLRFCSILYPHYFSRTYFIFSTFNLPFLSFFCICFPRQFYLPFSFASSQFYLSYLSHSTPHFQSSFRPQFQPFFARNFTFPLFQLLFARNFIFVWHATHPISI